jgi:hypothetical protein
MRQVSSRGIQAGRDVVDVGAETADWDGGVWPSNAIECRHVSFLSFRLLIISLSLHHSNMCPSVNAQIGGGT